MFRALFVIIWISTLLTASIGVSVKSIYCYCTGKTSVSLSVPLSNSSDDCCKKDAKVCCGVSIDSAKDTKPCKSGEAHFIKLKLDFSFEKTEKLGERSFVSVLSNIFEGNTLLVFSKKIHTSIADRAPPRAAGRALLPIIESWLC